MGLYHRLDLRSRITLAAGNVCLFTGVMVALLATDFARRHGAIFNGLVFGLPSLAIALNFHAMRSAGCGNKGQV